VSGASASPIPGVGHGICAADGGCRLVMIANGSDRHLAPLHRDVHGDLDLAVRGGRPNCSVRSWVPGPRGSSVLLTTRRSRDLRKNQRGSPRSGVRNFPQPGASKTRLSSTAALNQARSGSPPRNSSLIPKMPRVGVRLEPEQAHPVASFCLGARLREPSPSEPRSASAPCIVGSAPRSANPPVARCSANSAGKPGALAACPRSGGELL
jgi:hypothetical protein